MPLKQLVKDGNILVLFTIILTGSLAANLVTPIWPLYIRSLGASISELGYIFALSNAMAAILQIAGGLLSDRYGRKKLNAVGTFLGIFPPLFYTFAKAWVDLIPWVMIAGVANGLYLPSRWSIIADYSTTQNRAIIYGYMNIAFLVGYAFAPFVGGLIAAFFGISVTFFLCFMLMTLCFVFSLLLKEGGRSSREQLILAREEIETPTFFAVVLIFSSLNLIQAVGLGVTAPITPIFMERQFNVGYADVGILYAVGFGLSSMIVQIPGGKMATRYSEKKIILLTIIFSAPFFYLFAFSRSFAEAVVLMFVSNLILNLSWPAYQDLLIRLTPPASWGLMNGLSATFYWIGMMIGSALSGVLWESLGIFSPYYLSAIMVALSATPTIFLKEINRKT